MVAASVAGLGPAGAAMVAEGLRLYALLAALSLAGSLVWSAIGATGTAPDGLFLDFYRHAADRIDGRHCPSYPVCSLYARRAVRAHGLWLGSWLALDRLIHEHDDLHRGPWVRVRGVVRLYDPLSRNDFWLRGMR